MCKKNRSVVSKKVYAIDICQIFWQYLLNLLLENGLLRSLFLTASGDRVWMYFFISYCIYIVMYKDECI